MKRSKMRLGRPKKRVLDAVLDAPSPPLVSKTGRPKKADTLYSSCDFLGAEDPGSSLTK